MKLTKGDQLSLNELKENVLKEFPKAHFILFGSRARGVDTTFSDIDVLVLLNRKIDTVIEKKIFDIGYKVGLKYNVVFGIVVEEDSFLNSKLAKVMPFYKNVVKEGITI